MKIKTINDSCYTSKPLQDFIYENNKGKDVFFVKTQDEAIKKNFNQSYEDFGISIALEFSTCMSKTLGNLLVKRLRFSALYDTIKLFTIL